MRPILLALACLFAAPAVAQALAAGSGAYSPPRTPEGRPDFQGVWANQWLTPLEKNAAAGGDLVVPEAQAKATATRLASTNANSAFLRLDPDVINLQAENFALVKGERRTRLIVEPADGMLPYTPQAMQSLGRWFGWAAAKMTPRGDGPEDRLMWERCLAGLGQPPMTYSWGINGLRQIVQTPGAVVIHSETGQEARIIRIGGSPQPANMRSFLGDSRGRWEGDTLVIETTHFRSDDQFRMMGQQRPIMVGPDSKVVEKLTRISDDELLYQFTVEDPAIYAKPWLAEYSMMRTDDRMYEFACHEGNYGLPNILAGARASERGATKQKP